MKKTSMLQSTFISNPSKILKNTCHHTEKDIDNELIVRCFGHLYAKYIQVPELLATIHLHVRGVSCPHDAPYNRYACSGNNTLLSTGFFLIQINVCICLPQSSENPRPLGKTSTLRALIMSRPCGTTPCAHVPNSEMYQVRVPLLWVPPVSKVQPTQTIMHRKMPCYKVLTMVKR